MSALRCGDDLVASDAVTFSIPEVDIFTDIERIYALSVIIRIVSGKGELKMKTIFERASIIGYTLSKL